MTNLANLTTAHLHRIIAIKESIEKLHGEIDSIVGASAGGNGDLIIPAHVKAPKKRRMSRAGRAAIAAGARARWARIKGTAPAAAKPAKKKDRRSSPAVSAKLAAAARARWKKARAAGKKTL